MSVTQAIAQWTTTTRYADLPPEAVQVVKRMGLDTLGVSLAAVTEPAGRIIVDYTREAAGSPEASVIGGCYRTSTADAAFANGVLANALDFDDTWFPFGHPSCCVFPATMALGEKLQSSGKELIEAYLVGLEIWGKLRQGITDDGPSGFATVGIFGVLGAAVAASKLLHLTAGETVVALGIAASQAGGLGKSTGTMTKPYHAGNSAGGGIRAALLAQAGWTADPEPLEGPMGLLELAMGPGRFDPSRTIDALGNPFHVLEPGIGVKKYPTCYLNHRAIDALLKLVNRHDIRTHQVEQVTVAVPNETWMNDPNPENGLRARLSLQHNLAEVLCRGNVTIESFDNDRVHSREIRALMARVVMKVDSSMASGYRQVRNPLTLRLKDGRELTEQVDVPHGDWDDPLSEQEVLAKFRDNARRRLSGEECERTAQLMLHLDELDDNLEIMAISSGIQAQLTV